MQEEIANLKQLLQKYMNQASQVEALAQMEQEMRQQEHERKMEELKLREQEIEKNEEELSNKERGNWENEFIQYLEFSHRERKTVLKENINLDET